MSRRRTALAGLAGLAVVFLASGPRIGAGLATDSPGSLVPTLVVVGFANEVDGAKWRDLRLGMGLRTRLTECLTAGAPFALLEEKTLVDSVREAASGVWVRATGPVTDLGELQRRTGAAWLAHGRLTRLGVTRDKVSGLFSGRRWKYRAELAVCLRPGQGGAEICSPGKGESVTTVVAAGVEFRGEALAFDQAGPAEALDRALAAACAGVLAAMPAGASS